jgi:hypothetical protein
VTPATKVEIFCDGRVTKCAGENCGLPVGHNGEHSSADRAHRHICVGPEGDCELCQCPEAHLAHVLMKFRLPSSLLKTKGGAEGS